MGELLGPLDDQIIILLQTLSAFFDLFFRFITLFGDKLFIVGIILLFFLCIDKKLAIRLTFLLAFNAFITYAMKGFFGLKRPYLINQSEISGIPDMLGQLPDDYTFPSGHSSAAGAFWTFLTTQWRKPGFWIIAIFMIISIAISRCYLGVHWPTDVIIGTFLGIAISLLFVYFLPKLEEFIEETSSVIILLIAIILPIVGLAISYTLTIGVGNQVEPSDPSPWVGIFIGVTLGYLLEHRYVKLRVKEFRSNKKVLAYRATLSLIIIFTIYFASKAIFEMFFEGFPLAQIARLCRYAILAFVGIFCIPWLFVFIEQKLSLEPTVSAE